MKETHESKTSYSRRSFLKGAPIAVASGIVLGLAAGRPLLSRLTRRRKRPEFPKGSIFTPADDKRTRA